MQLNDLRSAPGARKDALRVGRGIGSGLGKTCGRGHKGQTSRTGGSIAPGFEGGQNPLHRRLPKFGFVSLKALSRAEVRTSELSQVAGDVVSLQSLRDAGLINAQVDSVKVMLSGEVTRALVVQGVAVTKGARAAVEAAGGKVEAVEEKAKVKKLAAKGQERPSGRLARVAAKAQQKD